MGGELRQNDAPTSQFGGNLNPRPLTDISACVFDVYGTLFDVSSISQRARDEVPHRWKELAELWRAKQLQYTWLRSLSGHHADFWQVTSDALDYALNCLELHSAGLRERLLNQYLHISPYPEVEQTLVELKSRGMRLAVLSNGTPTMLGALLQNSGLTNYFEAVLSIEEVGIYKPHPRVYALAPQRLNLSKERICFLSSNAWDAWAAKAFGFKVLWCNRTGQAAEHMPSEPDGQLLDLAALPSLIS
jgi:2-haloacid dehalogenase